MKAYVASAYSDHARASAFMRGLEQRGWTITEDWARHAAEHPPGAQTSDETARACAEADMVGVMNAQFLFVLLPPAGLGSGMWVEMGIALAHDISIILVGDGARNVFCHLADAHISTDQLALDAVVG